MENEPLIDRLAIALRLLRSLTEGYKPDDETMWELATVDQLVTKVLQEYDTIKFGDK
jgi:hypothetical protein